MDIERDTRYWYAVYTAPRAEKKVRERFLESGIEHYLPVQMVTRKWHDRMKKIEQPVLSGYIFVRILPEETQKVLMAYQSGLDVPVILLQALDGEPRPLAFPDGLGHERIQ